MRALSEVRFNALAGYCRKPESALSSEELAWFEAGDERVLGLSIRDRVDGDFAGIVLGRDRKERFRAIRASEWRPSQVEAQAVVGAELERLATAPEQEYYQDDERGEPVDFFTPRAPRDRLHLGFLKLAEEEAMSAARGIIEPMMRWHEDADGNFVEQFQTNGFDARIWELYLFAAFVEMGYAIDRTRAVPDFSCRGLPGELCVEAVTVGPTRAGPRIVPPPKTDTPDKRRAFLREYMPIKYAGPLTAKLGKRYWEMDHVAGKPFVLAIHDFHAPVDTQNRPLMDT